MPERMNILVTGAAGQLGCALRHILERGVSGYASLPDAYTGANVWYTSSTTLDITDEQAVFAMVDDNAIDLVINCAAFNDVDACETQQERAYLVNTTGARNLARAAQRLKVRRGTRLVHLSSDYVFAGDDPRPRTEGDPCRPINVYGDSKLLSERQVVAQCEQHFIVRTAWLYGFVGRSFVESILKLARTNGVIKVVDDQTGSPPSACDLALTLLKLALTDGYGTYHCASSDYCSRFEFASAIVDAAGIPCEKIPCSTQEFLLPARRPVFSALDTAFLCATLGEGMPAWHTSLTSYIDALKTGGYLP